MSTTQDDAKLMAKLAVTALTSALDQFDQFIDGPFTLALEETRRFERVFDRACRDGIPEGFDKNITHSSQDIERLQDRMTRAIRNRELGLFKAALDIYNRVGRPSEVEAVLDNHLKSDDDDE